MTALDDALEILRDTGPEFGGGLSNHGPMAAEALSALGRDEAVVPWVERYRSRLQDAPAGRDVIDVAAWRDSLGSARDVGDWVVFFQQRLRESPWRATLGVWTERLAPGMIGAAMHGIIRTAHATRSLESQETPDRLDELARGLGYWAARYQTLPVRAGGPAALLPSKALEAVPFVPEERRASGGLITTALAPLAEDRRFPDALGLVDSSNDPSAFVSDLTATFAAVYLANGSSVGRVVAFIHAVTGPSAVRLLLPYLPDPAVPGVLGYAWQAAASLWAGLGEQPPQPDRPGDADADDLIDRAVATGDEHAIKFTEACLREYAIEPQPVFLSAATHATGQLLRAR